MSLADIPVRGDGGEMSDRVRAVLKEIVTLLEHLVRTGDGGAIDLVALAGSDRHVLLDHLGTGEVTIELAIAGRSRIVETGYPGVWWVEHRNEQATVTGEYIEVTYAPDLIYAHPDDAENGMETLKRSIFDRD